MDILLRKMAVLWEQKLLDQYSLPYEEIHDELVVAVPEEKASRYREIIMLSLQEPVVELDNQMFPCEANIGRDWSRCK